VLSDLDAADLMGVQMGDAQSGLACHNLALVMHSWEEGLGGGVFLASRSK
jgi:hypothetical protein